MSSAKTGLYRLKPAAQADLENIWRYSAESWSPKQADAYIRDLTATFRLIVSMPLMARQRNEFTPPVRIHAHEAHLIVYVVDGPDIEILRILGGRQDWMSILKEIEA